MQGEVVDLHDWRLRVLSLDGRRINQVRADHIQPPPADTVEQPIPARQRRGRETLDGPRLEPSNLSNPGLTNHT